MFGAGIPSGLANLLGKLGFLAKAAGKPEARADVKAMKADKGEGPPGLEKGALLGDGELLAGLGFSGADKHAARMNHAEKANVARFLQKSEAPKKGEKEGAEGPPAREDAGAKEARDGREPQELREAVRREVQREEASQDARVQGREEQRTEREAKEQAEAKEQRERERDRDDEEKHGGAWVQEEIEEEEEERRRSGLKAADELGDAHRCRGALEDGTRCLRKPMRGTPYCREHAAAG